MKAGFDGEIKLEFLGAKVTSNSGLLAYRNLDYAQGLFDSASTNYSGHGQFRKPCTCRAGGISIKSGEFPQALGSSKDNKTLVASQPPRKAHQDRSEGCQAQRIFYVSNGGSYYR